LKIGVFDSGVGGLTVVKSILEHKLFEEIIYYGDTARVPYGSKDKTTIISYSLDALEFFKNFEIDMLIVACNTASAYAIEELQKNTDIPVIGVIESGVLALQDALDNKDAHILVLGTTATITSNLYANHLKKLGFSNINSIATPLFVPIVEESIKGAILEETMKYYFQGIDKVDGVILGCTHFPLIEKEISSFLNNCTTIHSGDAIVKLLQKRYNLTSITDETKISFFATSNPDGLKKVAKEWLELKE
jgi:glutamate racemase